MHKILVIDNNSDVRLLVNRFLTKNNYNVADADCGQAAIEWMKKNKPDLVLCDLLLRDMTAIGLMASIKERHPEAAVIIMADNSNTIKDAIEAMKAGAFDCVSKPLHPAELLMAVNKALHNAIDTPATEIAVQRVAKKMPVSDNVYNGQYITGNSLKFAEIIRQADLVAPTDFSVIIYGESGSGKEAIAQQIHQKSKRAGNPFIAIDCGALSKELSGSELFGHEKGAFTGALNQKIGSFELANEGTIFLDEIGNLPYDIQVSLLRVVQERRIRRVGGTKDIAINVRIIIASNVDLNEAAKNGKFREDLYHRFNEFSIAVPSLQDRKQDIMLFANHFLKQTNNELGKDIKGFTSEVEYLLTNYKWLGNIRELKNVIKRATLLTDGEFVELKSLPAEVRSAFNVQPVLIPHEKAVNPKIKRSVARKVSYQLTTIKMSSDDECEMIPARLNHGRYSIAK